MTNNEKLKAVCMQIADYKNTTLKTTYKRSIEKHYFSDLSTTPPITPELSLSVILADFPLVALHEELVNQGFLISYNLLCQIVAKLKTSKQSPAVLKNVSEATKSKNSQSQAKYEPEQDNDNSNKRVSFKLKDLTAESEIFAREAQLKPSPMIQRILEKKRIKNQKKTENNEHSSSQL